MEEPVLGDLDLAYRPRNYWSLAHDLERPVASDGINRPGVAPGFGDGGFLPESQGDEVEIALISLESTTGDVIAIRAIPVANGVRYAVVDEYESHFKVAQPVRPGPLSLGELIDLIDSVVGPDDLVGLVESHLEMALPEEDGDPAGLRDFIAVSSRFYPQLGDYYAARIEAWVEAKSSGRRGS